MARCSNCGAASDFLCQCTFSDSDCVDATGRGVSRQAVQFEPIFDPDSTSLIECGPAGMGVFLPNKLRNPPSCRVFSAFPQTIQNSVRQKLFFERERYDTDSMHDIEQNSSRITFHTAGVYLITASVQWEGNPDGDRKIGIRANTADIICFDERDAEQDDVLDQAIATIYKFEVDDYVEVIVGQNSDAARGYLRINDRSNYSPEFSATYLAVG